MSELKVGDVVSLKSNKSVRMTIRWIQEDSEGIMEANCDWFENKKLTNATFPVTSLTTDSNTIGVFSGY